MRKQIAEHQRIAPQYSGKFSAVQAAIGVPKPGRLSPRKQGRPNRQTEGRQTAALPIQIAAARMTLATASQVSCMSRSSRPGCSISISVVSARALATGSGVRGANPASAKARSR